MAALTVRPLTDADHGAWLPLWHRYLSYHGMWASDAPPETWPRLMDPAEAMYGVGAFANGQLVGFAHYLLHRHTWWAAPVCFLADVFTADSARRRGVARALVDYTFADAAARGADHVYGMTLSSNSTSQQLYDQVADRLHVVVYRHPL